MTSHAFWITPALAGSALLAASVSACWVNDDDDVERRPVPPAATGRGTPPPSGSAPPGGSTCFAPGEQGCLDDTECCGSASGGDALCVCGDDACTVGECAETCTSGSGCASGCCAEVDTGGAVCSPASFCAPTTGGSGQCIAIGDLGCADWSDCCGAATDEALCLCANEECTEGICEQTCFDDSDCSSGCCLYVDDGTSFAACAPADQCLL